MAVELYDDHEQGERVKQWIKTNGGGILLGVALAMGGLFGFRYWEGQQLQHSFNAAQQFQAVGEQLAELTASEQAQGDTDQESEGEAVADDAQLLEALATLQNDHPDNLYSALATLQVADMKLGEGDVDGAIQQYSFIITNSSNTEINSIAMLRLARAQLAQNQPEAVLQTLDGLPADSGHTSLVARIRGEAYLAMNDREQALQSFELAESELGGTPDRMLELRLADLRDIDIDGLLEDSDITQPPPAFPGGSSPIINSQPTSVSVQSSDAEQAQPEEAADSEATDTEDDQ